MNTAHFIIMTGFVIALLLKLRSLFSNTIQSQTNILAEDTRKNMPLFH